MKYFEVELYTPFYEEQVYIYLKGKNQEELEDEAAQASLDNAVEWYSFTMADDYGYTEEEYYEACGFRFLEITEKEYYEYGGT
jgi:hypothetical protein